MSTTPFIERNCVFKHEGRELESGGAVITDKYIVAYPAKDGVLADWHGNTIGRWSVVSSRPAIFFGCRSWQGDRYYYMRGTVNGVTYAMRGFGVGMIARGKRLSAAAKCRRH